MSTNFPGALDSYSTLIDNTDNIVAAHPNDRGDAIEALEAKVGVDSSAVATSHDYLLTHLPAQAQNWDAGAYDVRGLTLTSDVVTGTKPLNITSTTLCTNLNADQLDGVEGAGYQTILTNSAGLAAAINDEEGTGKVVFNTSPTLVTPVLGVATATSINGLTIDTTTGTLDVTNAKTLTVTGDATISATPYTPGGTDVAIADGGTGAGTAAAAINALLPSQVGNANKFLQTDASNPSWQTVDMATDVTGTLATGNGGTGATANANAANGVVVLDASSKISVGQLGSWESKTKDTTYLAATDGFVLGYKTSGTAPIYIRSDSSNPPTTTRAIVEPYENGQSVCAMSPVKKGDYWRAEDAAVVYWIPWGS